MQKLLAQSENTRTKSVTYWMFFCNLSKKSTKQIANCLVYKYNYMQL